MSSNTSLGGGSNSLAGKQSTNSTKSKSETVNYLLLYEAMVRHQDLEFDATHDHMALTVERIQYLGRKSAIKNAPELLDENTNDATPSAPKGMLTYLQMRRCLLRLGYTWNRSQLLPSSNNSISEEYDDDVSIMSATSASSFISGGASASSGSLASTRDIIATDSQLIMLLTTLVEMEEHHRAMQLAHRDENDDEEEKEEESVYSQGLFLPEFIQAYKLIIGGMQSLQTYPTVEDSRALSKLGIRAGDALSLQELHVRSRERTLGLLKLFGPDSQFYNDDPLMNNGVPSTVQQSAGESPTAHSSGNKNGGKKSRDGLTPNKKKKGNKIAKDGLLPRLTEEEIRKLVHSKDTALAKILEEHESEMNVMATNMEELRRKGLLTRNLIAQRRKRTRMAVVAGVLLVACGGGAYEYHKREQVKVEIATGREAERLADARIILNLKESVSGLTSKLNDAEATIRYEEGRYNDVKKKFEKASKKVEVVEGQWHVDQKELTECRVTRKELDADLTTIKVHNEAIEEEVGWCRQKLEGAERAVEGMEQAVKKSRKEKGVVPSVADIAKEMKKDDGKKGAVSAGDDKGKDGKGSGGVNAKPVKMEMKYNKSFRNAVLLRQVYAALAGAVVSALLPGVFKAIGLLL